jgi:hypothetical protein
MSISGRDLENDSSNNVSAHKNEIHPTGRGVLTVAADHPKYAEQAVALARSIRLRDRNIPLAVLTNLPEEHFLGLYDYVISWNFQVYPGLLSKLVVYDGSPFEETLFLDADILAIRSVNEAFNYFIGHEFAVWGRNIPEPYWFRGIIDRIREYFPAETYPSFNSGMLYFRKSETARLVFAHAKNLVGHYYDLGLRKTPRGLMSDEPLLSIAMARTGLRALENSDIPPISWSLDSCAREMKVDVLAGTSSVPQRDGSIQPALVHFAGRTKNLFIYRREMHRLAAAYPSATLHPLKDYVVRAAAYVAWRWSR